jgi:hypothetical protein
MLIKALEQGCGAEWRSKRGATFSTFNVVRYAPLALPTVFHSTMRHIPLPVSPSSSAPYAAAPAPRHLSPRPPGLTRPCDPTPLSGPAR